MLGTGGNAYISKLLGEKEPEKARSIFSLVVYTTITGGIVICVLGQLLLRPVASMLGAEGEMLDYAVTYGRIVLIGGVPFMLQMEFQSLFNTTGKPKLGLIVTIAAGVSNIVLDALLIMVFKMGLVGAALATTIGMCIGGVFPVVYFAVNRTGILYLEDLKFDGKALAKICTNGMSEMVTQISMSLVSMLFNVQLLKYAGENGIVAYGVLMYVNMIFLSAFIGYSLGTAPIIGFHYGAKNTDELKSLLKKSTLIISVSAICMTLLSMFLRSPLSSIYTSYDRELYDMTVHGFLIYSLSFLFAGIPIYGSSFFTALSNGKVSAAISFMRTLVFETLTALILPVFLGTDGIWLSIVIAEFLAAAAAGIAILINKKKYQYL